MQKSTTQVQRFVAADMSSALKLLTARFGADAILLASRRVANGVEVAGLPPGADASAIETSQIYRERRYSERRASERRERNAGASDSTSESASPATQAEPLARQSPAAGRDELPGAAAAAQASEPHPQRRTFGESLARLRTDYASLLGDTHGPAHANAHGGAEMAQPADNLDAGENTSDVPATSGEAGDLRRAASVLARQIDALQGTPVATSSAAAGELPAAAIQLELKALKDLLANSLQRESGAELLPQPAQYIVLQRLRQMGFSAAVASALLRSAELRSAELRSEELRSEELRSAGNSLGTDPLEWVGERQVETLWTNCQAQLLSVLPVCDSDPLDGAGVFALLGPAGAGVTSVIAMLLARFVQRNKAADVAVISMEGARSGLLAQLAELAGISYLAVDGDFPLAARIAQCARFRTVLIDTGSAREDSPRLPALLAELRSAAVTISEVLLLPATGEQRYLQRIIRQYRGPQTIACVLTFYDQLARLGEILSVLLRERLNVAYTASGTLLPEHLQVPVKQALLDQLVFAEDSDPDQGLVEQVMAPTVNVKVDNATHSMSI